MMKYIIIIILIIVILWNAVVKSKKEGFRIMPKIKLPKMPNLKIKGNINKIINKTKRGIRHKKEKSLKETLHMIRKYL